MFKKIFNLFKITRKLSCSGAIDTINEIKTVPKSLNFIFYLFSIGSSKRTENLKKSSGEKLCESLEDMGTTFIKLGQFLSTRPDIIGEKLSNKLEKLQDRVPEFPLSEAKEILKKNIGEQNYNLVLNISEPVAAASIAQVHKAQIAVSYTHLTLPTT